MAQWLRFCATDRKVAGSIPAGVDSASNRNEYEEHFLGVQAAGAKGWQPYHYPVPLSRNLGTLSSWNPLDQACKGTVIPVYTGLFISPSGISELDCATTKADTAERSISTEREALQGSFLPYRCSICPSCCVCLGCCAADFGSSGGTYE